MPTIKTISREPLSEAELPAFRAWAQSRPGFRATSAAHEWYIPEIRGGFMYARRVLTLAELVERWRSLGRPQPYVRYTRRGALRNGD